mgnify:CR=1 FL=1
MSSKKTGTYLKRPTKISILNQTYKVQWVHSSEDHGNVDLNKCIISITKGFPQKTTAATLLHEMLHIIYTSMGVTDKMKEEDIVSRMETGISTAWKDNPSVFQWLHKHLTKP